MTRYLRLLLPIVIAVVLGPLIAGLAVCVVAIANNLVSELGVPLALLFPMFGFYIIFAYIFGGAIALLAGILVALWMISRPPSLIVVVAAAVIATAVYLGLGALGLLPADLYANARSNVVLYFALAAVAATGCWLLMRRFAPTS